MSSYSKCETGACHGLDYKIYIHSDGKVVSPFHDIPLYPDPCNANVFNMVVEVPRWSNAKFEINKADAYNPIKQDIKKGKPRFVHNIFPFSGYIWNYGAIPQTWEDPNEIDPSTGAKGDNDPIDVLDIGSKVHERGSVLRVKVLGTFALIDEGETDWKIIGIDVTDPMAERCNDLDDVEKNFPGLLRATHDWFRLYKVPDGKPPNVFAFDGMPKGKDFALDVIRKTHEQWKKLVTGDSKCSDISLVCTETKESKYQANGCSDFIKTLQPAAAPLPIPDEVRLWHYVSAPK